MKIDAIHLYSNGVKYAEFSFMVQTQRQSYTIVSATGLDAGDIRPQYYGKAAYTQDKFFGLNLPPRMIAMRIKMNSNADPSLPKTYSDLRNDMYKAISASRTGLVELRFIENNIQGAIPIAAISGFPVKFEASLFVKDPEIQITLKCEDPLFKSTTQVDFGSLGTSPTPEFIDLKSNTQHGFYFSISFLEARSSFEIKDAVDSKWHFFVDRAFVEGDILFFSSENQNQYLYMLSYPTMDTIQLADRVSADSTWPLILPGQNVFQYADTADVIQLEEASHYETYIGL